MQYVTYKKLTGKIKILTGLHIGGNKDNIEIGGIDNPVIKDPISRRPYIPGSSIKGKMRFLMEWKLGKIADNGEPHGAKCADSNCPICRIFGNTHKERKCGPTRIRISDCPLALSPKDEEDYKDKPDYEKKLHDCAASCLEDKVENRINRLSGTATDPRHTERVAPGTFFDFELAYKIFQIDREKQAIDEDNWQTVIDALCLLQEDGLGGCVSRGYGQFRFVDLKLDGQSVELVWNDGKASLKAN